MPPVRGPPVRLQTSGRDMLAQCDTYMLRARAHALRARTHAHALRAGPVDAKQLAAVEAICRQQLAQDYAVFTQEVALARAKEIVGLRWGGRRGGKDGGLGCMIGALLSCAKGQGDRGAHVGGATLGHR